MHIIRRAQEWSTSGDGKPTAPNGQVQSSWCSHISCRTLSNYRQNNPCRGSIVPPCRILSLTWSARGTLPQESSMASTAVRRWRMRHFISCRPYRPSRSSPHTQTAWTCTACVQALRGQTALLWSCSPRKTRFPTASLCRHPKKLTRCLWKRSRVLYCTTLRILRKI